MSEKGPLEGHECADEVLRELRSGRGEPAMSQSMAVAHEVAKDYIAQMAGVPDSRPAGPDPTSVSALPEKFPLTPLPEEGVPAHVLINELHSYGSGATAGLNSGTYFGFVQGATLPAALGASWLLSAWDQNHALQIMSPVASHFHQVVRGYLVELLGLPTGTETSFVASATSATIAALATARDAQLRKVGWDVQKDGLIGAPRIHVVVGAKCHSTTYKALGLVGLGRSHEWIHVVAADEQGRMRPDCLPDIPEGVPVILILQAGDVNTGAFDPFPELIAWAKSRSPQAWTHVDGAFGLWALVDAGRAHLTNGLIDADSWITDGHKFLNMTYDAAICLVREKADLGATFSTVAGYLPPGEGGHDAMHFTPQSSQRARCVEAWAVLRSLGKSGLRALIVSNCTRALELAKGLTSMGFTPLNDVVFNQALFCVRYNDNNVAGHKESALTRGAQAGGRAWTTADVISAIQKEGTCWMGPTQWNGETAMRVSVSGWNTTAEDVSRCLQAIEKLVLAGPTPI